MMANSEPSDVETFYMDIPFIPQTIEIIGEPWMIKASYTETVHNVESYDIILESIIADNERTSPITLHVQIYLLNSSNEIESLIGEGFHSFDVQNKCNIIALYGKTGMQHGQVERLKIEIKRTFSHEIDSKEDFDPHTSGNRSSIKNNISADPTTPVHETVCDSSCESLSTDLGNLLKTGYHSDIVLNIENKTINAHKCILASRSDVFKDMLHVDLKTIDIQNIAYDSVDIFVQYLYSAKLPSVTIELARDLTKLADTYAVVELKKKCAAFLIENISRKNVLDTLQFADSHGDNIVKEKAIRFIIENQILLSCNWEEFSENNLKLSNEVYRYFVEDRMSRASRMTEDDANRKNAMNCHILKKVNAPHINENESHI